MTGLRTGSPHGPLNTVDDVVKVIDAQGDFNELPHSVLATGIVSTGQRLNLFPVSLEPNPLGKGVPHTFYKRYILDLLMSAYDQEKRLSVVAWMGDNESRFCSNIFSIALKDNVDEDEALSINHPA